MSDIELKMGKPRIRLTADGLANVVTGLGTGRDRRMYNQFRLPLMQDFQELEAAYMDNWIAGRVVDTRIDDATREWRSFSTDDATMIKEAEKKYNLKHVTRDAFRWSGVYGGAGVLLITDQPFDEELRLEKIKKGSLKRLLVLDRMYITGQDYNLNNPLSASYMLPEYYTVQGGTQQIHHSHFIKAPGVALPMRLRMLNGGWDDSRLRRCMEDLKDSVAAKAGIASLIIAANVDVISKKGLADALASGDMDQAIVRRFLNFDMLKSSFKLALLDEEEVFDRKQIAFGGLGDVLTTLMEWTAGAADTPMTRLFGVQSKGLGDSGEGDESSYFDKIRGEQESYYRPFLEAIDQVMFRSEFGAMPEDYQFEFNPLSQPNDTEKATQELAYAQADSIRLNEQGVVKRSQIARKLKEQGTYAIEESDITEIKADEAAERAGEYQFKRTTEHDGKQQEKETTSETD